MNPGLKTKKLNDLTRKELMDLTKLLVENLGYQDIENNNNHIIGWHTTPLGKESHLFIFFNIKLESNEEMFCTVQKTLDELLGNGVFNTLYIVSTHTISNSFKRQLKYQNQSKLVDFIERDKIINLIDQFKIDYWRHTDTHLLKYEKFYKDVITKDTELKRLKIFNDKYSNALDFFIEPSIFFLREDKESNIPTRLKVNIPYVINRKNPVIISGDTGTGKTTILKKIGEEIISNNSEDSKKTIPLFVSATDILSNDFKIEELINIMFSQYFESGIEELAESYSIYLLIDSIDEFEQDKRKSIIKELDFLNVKYKIIYILCTRNQDRILENGNISKKESCVIEKFTNDQIKQFVDKFFPHKNKAESFLDALKDNRILERLPITPLSLSLISILFEEKDFEIPATISDIYDNFNTLLLGKALVSSRFEFIDINFKERILSIYGLELLKRKSNAPMELSDFYNFFETYFKTKSTPVELDQFKELLEYLIESSGVLTIKDNKYVQFTHNSFMEYYASLEIFNHRRDLESLLIDNFFKTGWQNTSIFYAGKSKDMPTFLKNINKTVEKAKDINQFYSGVMGLGYLLQALYQTDNKIRKESVSIALDANIKAYETLIKIAADEKLLFKDFKLPLIAIINLIYFYENFNSITLREPLKLNFNELLKEFQLKNDTTTGYKALKLALTLNSERIKSDIELEKLIFETKLTDNPTLNVLTNFSLTTLKDTRYREFKKEVSKSDFKLKEPIKQLLEKPISKLKHSALNEIKLEKKIKILTEGITDADIIEHAYMTLTKGSRPYWSITSVKDGGAANVAKALVSADNIINEKEVIIGVFDNDAKGIQEFNGALKPHKFDLDKDIKRLKKHKLKNIFALRLPIPQEKQHYIKSDQNFNFFAIEHYFSYDFLNSQEMLIETEIKDVYKINDKKKTAFSKFIRKQSDPKIFRGFVDLLRLIDAITDIEIEYSF